MTDGMQLKGLLTRWAGEGDELKDEWRRQSTHYVASSWCSSWYPPRPSSIKEVGSGMTDSMQLKRLLMRTFVEGG
jgi:hypothetical protein